MNTTTYRDTAIRAILRTIGESHINLDSNDVDVADAGTVLDMAVDELLSQNWEFNTHRNRPFTLDQQGFIRLPSNISQVTRSKRGDPIVQIVNGLVFDMERFTSDMRPVAPSGVHKMDCTLILSYENLPPLARNAALAKARKTFLQDINADGTRLQALIKEETESYAKLLEYDKGLIRANYFEASKDKIHWLTGSR